MYRKVWRFKSSLAHHPASFLIPRTTPDFYLHQFFLFRSPMYYTYILKSVKQPGAIYIGSTADLRKRLRDHNKGSGSRHTTKYLPWRVESFFAFTDRNEAEHFEVYLKSNSGRSFMRKRLLSKSFVEDLSYFSNGKTKPN